jgi:hypothetical protein
MGWALMGDQITVVLLRGGVILGSRRSRYLGNRNELGIQQKLKHGAAWIGIVHTG